MRHGLQYRTGVIEVLMVDNQRLSLSVAHDLGEPLRGMAGIQRHIGAACQRRAQDAREVGQLAVAKDRTTRGAASEAGAEQGVGNAAGEGKKFAIRYGVAVHP